MSKVDDRTKVALAFCAYLFLCSVFFGGAFTGMGDSSPAAILFCFGCVAGAQFLVLYILYIVRRAQ